MINRSDLHVGSSSIHDEERSAEKSPFLDGVDSPRDLGSGSQSFDSAMEELASVAAQQSQLAIRQSMLVAQARASHSTESARAQYEGQIASLTAQLASLQADLASSKAEQLSSQAKLERAEASARLMADQKMMVMAELERERSNAERTRTASLWGFQHLQQAKNKLFADVEEFRSVVQLRMKDHEERFRKLSIEFDEELYPHLMQSLAERR